MLLDPPSAVSEEAATMVRPPPAMVPLLRLMCAPAAVSITPPVPLVTVVELAVTVSAPAPSALIAPVLAT